MEKDIHLEMKDTVRRWDWAWKVFCSPTYPWCRFFLTKLLGEQYKDYEVAVDLNQEIESVTDNMQYADKFLQLTVDNVKGIVHLEFQSTVCSSMGARMFTYGFARREPTNTSAPYAESYVLPDSVLVNVHPRAASKGSFGSLSFDVWGQRVNLKFPVVNAYEEIPEISSIMQARTIEQLKEAVVRLAVQSGAVTEDAYISSIFSKACLLISKQEAFAEGVTDVVLDKEVYRAGMPIEEFEAKFIEIGRQRGFQEAIEQGLQQGREQGLQQGLQQGRAQGLQQGRAQGLQQGLQQGREEGIAEIVRGYMERNNCSREQAVEVIFGKASETPSSGFSGLHIG